MPLSLDLADRILAFDPIPAAAALDVAARNAIADTLGVMLLGASEESTRILAVTPGIAESAGPCVIVGTDLRRSPLDAALLNGVASHAHDFDDFTQVFGGHPSVPVLPALLALADTRPVTGAALIHAYAIGVEAETRIAMGVHFRHYEKGWHPTSTLGVFGAAAASAWLMGLDRQRIATALCIAASLSSGIKANFGTMTKPLHVGHCARNGLLAALLAEAGFSASVDALEAPQGFLDVYNGPGEYETARMLDGWYRPPALVKPGLSVKQFPCCGSTHPAIYAALELRRTQAIDPDALTEVEIRTHPRRLPHTDNPAPQTPLEAKFSIQYCVCRALVSGGPSLKDFEADAVGEPAVRRLMDVTRVIPDGSVVADAERTFGAVVSIRDAGGRRLESKPVHSAGRGPDNPMGEDELRAKFTDCAQHALPADRVDALWSTLMKLEALDEVSELTALTSADEPRRRAATA